MTSPGEGVVKRSFLFVAGVVISDPTRSLGGPARTSMSGLSNSLFDRNITLTTGSDLLPAG